MLTADAGEAARRAVGEARVSLGTLPASFAVLFASAYFFASAEALVAAVAAETGQLPLIGCVAEAVAGGAREVESEPAVSLWLAAGLGPVETFAMEFVRDAQRGVPSAATRSSQDPGGIYLMVCDPFTFPVSDLLGHLNQHVPGRGGHGRDGERRSAAAAEPAVSRRAGALQRCRRRLACREPRSIRWWRRDAARLVIRTPPPAPTAM